MKVREKNRQKRGEGRSMRKLISIVLCWALTLVFSIVGFSFAKEAREPLNNVKPREVRVKREVVERVPLGKTLGETQFFCGYCHVLTYPEIMKRAHQTWKEDKKHNEVGCVECHYPPDLPPIPEHRRIPRTRAEAEKKRRMTDWEFMKTELEVFSKLVTILNMDEKTVLRRPKIDDRSCTTWECHPTDRPKTKQGEYWEKKLKFTEYEKIVNGTKQKVPVYFTHKAHYDRTKWVEGQELHCVTCHRKESNAKHFEVSKESCYLCHFKYKESPNPNPKEKKEVGFAKGRAACNLCHKIPEEPFKQVEAGEKPITHKDYEERKVPCASCHLHQIRGRGEVNEEKCLDCHVRDKKIMKEARNMKLMHKEHVAKQTAHCFNCHEPIQHKKEFKDYIYVDASLAECRACHPEPHIHQRLLLAGIGAKGIDKAYPIKHHEVKTNCLSCHTKDAHTEKGIKFKAAEEQTCVRCHEQEAAETMKGWVREVSEVLKEAKALEKEALEALERAKGKIPQKDYQRALELITRGRENVRLVEAGGGAHNKKYATLVLDAAIADFEEAMALLKLNSK